MRFLAVFRCVKLVSVLGGGHAVMVRGETVNILTMHARTSEMVNMTTNQSHRLCTVVSYSERKNAEQKLQYTSTNLMG